MMSIIEISDKSCPITYEGTCIASNSKDETRLQNWCIIDTVDEGEMLFIDNELQSCRQDEAIYHEMFVHSLMIGGKGTNVLILGGAEGCVTREVLKWNVDSVTHVDWDSTLVEQFKNRPWTDSYTSSKLRVFNEDALTWMKKNSQTFDYIFIDLLDPNEYNMDFFQNLLTECKRSLAPGGGLSINAGVVRKAFTPACTLTSILKNIFSESLFGGLHVYVPSFRDEWGFLMILPKTWSIYMHETYIPSVTYFTREKLINAMSWDSLYPEALRNFWKESSPKKLTACIVSSSVDLDNHYGC